MELPDRSDRLHPRPRGASDPQDQYLSLRRAVAVTASAAWLGTTALFTTAVAAAAADAFDARAQYPLLLVAGLAGAGVGMLLAGGIVGRRGPVALARLGAAIIVLAAAGNAVAPAFPVLVVLVALAGVGRGFSGVAAIGGIPVLAAPRHRGVLFGVAAGMWGLSGTTVPFVVAGVVEQFGWRAVYVVELVVVLVAACTHTVAARGPRRATRDVAPPRFDVRGALLVVVAAGGLQFTLGAPAVAPVLGPLVLLAVVLFVRHVRRAPAPIFTARQLVGPRVLPLHLAGAAGFVGAWGLSAVAPVVVRDGFGASAVAGAAVLTGSSVGWLVGSLAAGPLGRLGRRPVLTGAFGLQVLALAGGAALFSRSLTGYLLVTVVVGIGAGVSNNGALSLVGERAERVDVQRSLSALQYLCSVASGATSGLVGMLVLRMDTLAGLRWAQAGAALLCLGALLLVLRPVPRAPGADPAPPGPGVPPGAATTGFAGAAGPAVEHP